MVIKNIDKNPLYYVEEAQFGIKGIGYSEDQPALGKGKMVKDAGKGGGYGEATKKDFPKDCIGKHSLKAWGNRIGEYKEQIETDWQTFTPEMLEYCKQDTEVTYKLYKVLEDIWNYRAMLTQEIKNNIDGVPKRYAIIAKR